MQQPVNGTPEFVKVVLSLPQRLYVLPSTPLLKWVGKFLIRWISNLSYAVNPFVSDNFPY